MCRVPQCCRKCQFRDLILKYFAIIKDNTWMVGQFTKWHQIQVNTLKIAMSKM